jgi:hypothetical protein
MMMSGSTQAAAISMPIISPTVACLTWLAVAVTFDSRFVAGA